jgi:hypothetical protein
VDRTRITRWSLPPIDSPVVRPSVAPTPIKVGDYLCSERELYHVEQIGSERAMIEDCRTGELMDALIADLSQLRHVDTS